MDYTVSTLSQRPDYRARIDQLSAASWPAFLLHGDTHHWDLLFDLLADDQLLLCDEAGELLAVGHTVPFVWDGSWADLPTSIEEILLRGERAALNQQAPNTLSAVAAMVTPAARGRALSSQVVIEMRALAKRRGCDALLAPVRPPWKSRYPLTPMERYAAWRRSDGAPFDPWIRVHWRLGAEGLGVAPNTLTVEGTVAEWEEWTGMAFPESGPYVVSGALQPVMIDCERNLGRYEDPNYWMKHPVNG